MISHLSTVIYFNVCNCQNYVGRLSFTTDAWTSPNHKAYIAVTVHFEQDGAPISLLLDLVQVAKSHTGVTLAAVFTRILKDFGIAHKVSRQIKSISLLLVLTQIQILSVTCDNASNNDKMVRQLEQLIDEFKGQESQTRCFTHILNLIAKSIIRQFDVPKAQYNRVFDKATMALMELAGDIEREEQAIVEMGDDREDDEEDENTEDWVDERDTMSEEQLNALDESARPVRLMLVKVGVYLGTRRQRH
jgi:hypothetical protein